MVYMQSRELMQESSCLEQVARASTAIAVSIAAPATLPFSFSTAASELLASPGSLPFPKSSSPPVTVEFKVEIELVTVKVAVAAAQIHPTSHP